MFTASVLTTRMNPYIYSYLPVLFKICFKLDYMYGSHMYIQINKKMSLRSCSDVFIKSSEPEPDFQSGQKDPAPEHWLCDQGSKLQMRILVKYSEVGINIC